MVKFYSDVTKNFYETEKECLAAEFKVKEEQNREKIRKEREAAIENEKREKANAERKEAAARVEEARKAMTQAQTAYKNELDKFITKYGTYHYSTTNANEIPILFDLFDSFLKF